MYITCVRFVQRFNRLPISIIAIITCYRLFQFQWTPAGALQMSIIAIIIIIIIII